MKRNIKTLLILLSVLLTITLYVPAGGSKEQGDKSKALDFPKRPIEIVVPFGPGGSSDMMTRQVASIMTKIVGKPVNVVNRAGGGGIDGMVYVAKAPADGYTLLQITPSHAIATALGRPNADLLKDFDPVANFQIDIQCFGVAKNSKFKSLDDILEYAKANPGKVKIGGTSPGGLDEYMANGFAKAAGVQFLYVPYNAAAETKAAVLGGEIDIYQDKVISFLTMVRADQIRPIVVLNNKRLDMIEELKNVPCSVEKGIQFTQGSWRGFAVRKGTPQPIRDYLAEVIKKVYESPEYREASKRDMSDIIPGYIGPKEYGEMWVSEIAKFKEILGKK
ncbi:MAG: tripartite tricarboxylate transporter substrate binding protein [Spirochaetes bacterium]|nr:tripartite tricarboxylate transporter substrate binding protein [Spirochaetota bacterium]